MLTTPLEHSDQRRTETSRVECGELLHSDDIDEIRGAALSRASLSALFL
jgi:hypothetical protein